MNHAFGITHKLTAVFIVFAACVLAAVGLLAYNSGRNSLRSATIAELLSTAIEKESGLNTWVDEKQADIAQLTADPAIIKKTSVLFAARHNSTDGRASQKQLLEELQPRIEGGEFIELFLLDPDTGEVVLSTDAGLEGKPKENQPYFINGKTGPYIQNLYYSSELQEPAMTAAAPVRGADGQLLAVLAGRLNLEEMNAIIKRRTGLRQSDEAFLINTSNLFVTQPRLLQDRAVLERGIHTPAVTNCLKGNSGLLEAPDYRGVPAIIVYRWMPQHRLCLIVKLEQSEAYAPARAFGLTVAGISSLILLTAAALAVMLSHSLTRPILRLQDGVIRFRHGDRGVRLPETRHDELGVLAREFNRMAISLSEKEVELREYAQTLEQKVHERTLTLQETLCQLHRAEQIGHIGSWEWQVSQNRVRWTDGLYRVFGLEPQEFGATYEAYLEQVHPDDRDLVRQAVEHAYSAGGAFEFESRILRQDAESRYLYTRGETQVGEQGNSARMLGIAIDITERKRAEESLQRLTDELRRSNAELEQFAYVASHDLQEPLRMISSYVQLLASRYQGKLDSDADEFIAFAVDGATRMQNLINDLLAYSRVGTRGAEPVPVPAQDLLQEALTNLRFSLEESGARITQDALPIVTGDRLQLVMVFQNLLANSIKFRGSEPPCVHIGVRREGDEWVFSVRDNGIGFDQKFAERVFVIFQRLNTRGAYPGTGIGLAICKRIITRHGGRIWAESERGQGSVFYFTLPIAAIKRSEHFL